MSSGKHAKGERMPKFLENFLRAMRPAFSRQATFAWFVIVFVGFLLPSDTFGVSSIVRALSLVPESYTCLLHFFHSTAWTVEGLMGLWWGWLAARKVAYHFWSQYLSPASRRPRKKARHEPCSSSPLQTRNTLNAIEKFVNVLLLVLGTLQLTAKVYPKQVRRKAHCWLRTMSTYTPSEFVTRTALSNIIRSNLYGFGKDWITRLIQGKQKHPQNKGIRNMAA
jgi:hypothetical protein